MSTDAQPRKRKDKKKKKDEREVLSEKMSAAPGRAVTPPPPTPVPPVSSDEIMHIYKEGKVGGSTFTKALFFGIMTALAVTISVVIMSSPGRDVLIQQSDHGEEGVSTSTWSLDLGIPLWSPFSSEGPEEGHGEEHAEDSGHKDEHGDHEEQHEEEGHEEHEHEEPDEGGFMSWLGWGGTSSDQTADEQHHEEEHGEEEHSEEPAAESLSSWFGWGGGEESTQEEPSEHVEESSSSSWFGWGSTEEPVQEDVAEEESVDAVEASEEVATTPSGKHKVKVEIEETPEEEEEEEEEDGKEQEEEEEKPGDEADNDEVEEDDTLEPEEENQDDNEEDNLSQPEEEDDDDELDTFLSSLDLEPNLKRDSRAHIQQDRARQQRAAAEERAREERAREERAREERAREERARELRIREERAREERMRELRAREERERARELRLREERAREMRLREERAREEVARLERLRQEQLLQKQREETRLEEEKAEQEEKKVMQMKKKSSKVSEEDDELFPEAAEALRLEKHNAPPPQEDAVPEEVTPEEEAPFSRDDLVDEDMARAEEEEEQVEEEEEEVVEEIPVKEKVSESKAKPVPGSVAAKASEFLAEQAAERAVRETQAPLRDLPPPPSHSPEPSDEEEEEEVSEQGYSGGEEVLEEEDEEQSMDDRDVEEESPIGSDIDLEPELEEDEEELSEDEEVPVAAQKTSAPSKQRNSGAQAYQHEDITDDYDWAIREELDLADDEFRRNPSACLKIYQPLQANHDNSPRLRVAVAKCLDSLSKQASSNKLLESAIRAYKRALELDMKDRLFLDTAQTLIVRLRFRGFISETIPIHQMLISRFGEDPKHRNDLAISYLMLNKLNEAERVLNKTVGGWPKDGVARAHYGLTLKLQGKYEESIAHLEAGLQLNVEATKDARFYFHLGDAFVRTGRPNSAEKTYEKGVSLGLFRSKYQRSLYNVERLKPRPWWTPLETTYISFFRKLESNWKSIREEGLKAIEYKKGFLDESESLRHTGDWKQFELYARGVRNNANCERAKLTCQLISEFDPARTCRRGQAKFSLMEGGTHVWPHCGPTNCRLRAHLGLVVPSGPEIRVANITRRWQEGQVIIFDDSFEHEVWHRGTEPRLVLIVDVWHPELTPAEIRTLSPI